ncbi:MAG: glycosyltransferase family 2 protein [Parcubacteria group bacterium]|nr:glycosyltransferase family 2 protein [Parcubacteria group bacterium]
MKINNNKFKVSLVICTKDRPNDLSECLDSVLLQTELPDEVIIVDSSNNDAAFQIVQKHKISNLKNIKIICKYSNIQSSTHQRNLGVDLATGTIIHFLDDDVILEPDYFEKINDIYKKDRNCEIGGVGGLIIQANRISGKNFVADLFKRIFLLTNDNGLGKMLPSGWGTVQYRSNTTNIAETEILQGCCSYRKEVLNEYKFDENLTGAAIREDLDISYRVSRKYKLIYTPFAKLYHKSSPAGREKEKLYYQKYTFNHYYLFKKNMKHSMFNILCFIWSDIGSVIGIILLSLKKGSFEPIKGALNGYIQIFKDLTRK